MARRGCCCAEFWECNPIIQWFQPSECHASFHWAHLRSQAVSYCQFLFASSPSLFFFPCSEIFLVTSHLNSDFLSSFLELFQLTFFLLSPTISIIGRLMKQTTSRPSTVASSKLFSFALSQGKYRFFIHLLSMILLILAAKLKAVLLSHTKPLLEKPLLEEPDWWTLYRMVSQWSTTTPVYADIGRTNSGFGYRTFQLQFDSSWSPFSI